MLVTTLVFGDYVKENCVPLIDKVICFQKKAVENIDLELVQDICCGVVYLQNYVRETFVGVDMIWWMMFAYLFIYLFIKRFGAQ